MSDPRWLIYALLSAIAASFVGIFGKIGMKDVDPTLATGIRSVVMTVSLIGVCYATSVVSRLSTLSHRAMAMIILSGIAGAASWLFYFRAIQLGTVSQVAPIDKLSMPLAVILAVLLLKERPSLLNWFGIILIVTGALLAAIPRVK